MRSSVIYTVLAFTGIIDLTTAGRCAPSQVPTSTTDAATNTPTTPSSSTTQAPVVVTNIVAGGNFAAADPNYRNDIHGFESEGNCRLVQGQGYQGDHSQETGCVIMDSDEPVSVQKRQAVTDWDAVIEQYLGALNTASLYTVRFFYAILQNDAANTCRIDAYYGDEIYASTKYFPVTNVVGNNYQWLEFVEQVAVQTDSGWLRFALNCGDTGHAQILIDQIFMSDQVNPQNIDTISLSYISEVSPATTLGTLTTRTTTTASATSTKYCPTGVSPGTCEISTEAPDDNSMCSVTGYIIGIPYSASTGPGQDSPEACAWLCRSQPGCVAFGVTEKSNQCNYVSLRLASGFYTPNDASDTIWWDMTCMTCCDADALPAPN